MHYLYFSTSDYQIATRYLHAIVTSAHLHCLKEGVNTVSPQFVRAGSKGTNVQTGKDRSFTSERLVKIVLIDRVSTNKYGVGDILER